MLKRVSVNAWAASADFKVEASKFPKVTSRGVHYLSRIAFFCDYPTVTTGAGGAATPIELHDLLANVEMSAGGDHYGPQNLSGHELDYLFSAMSPVQPGENVEAEGDENVPASTTGADRQILSVFAFDLIGAEPGDYAPPTKYLAELGGQLEVRFSALPTNATAVTGDITTYIETMEAAELRAVPAVRAVMTGVNALTGGSLAGGKLHFLGLKRTADLTDSLIDLWRLSADGEVVTDMGDPSWIQQLVGSIGNAGAVGDNLQEAGSDALSGTRPRFTQLYPHKRYGDDRRLTKRVNANAFTYELTSTLTASEYEFLQLVSRRLTGPASIEQAASCGVCDRQELIDMIRRDPEGAAKPKTSSKKPGVAPRHQGWIPIKFNVDPAKFGIRGT